MDVWVLKLDMENKMNDSYIYRTKWSTESRFTFSFRKKNDSSIFVSVMIKLVQFVPKLKTAVLYPFAYIIIRIETRSYSSN